MLKKQRENCAVEGWDRESLIQSALFIQLLYYTKGLSAPLRTSRNLLEIGAELVEIIGNFAPSDWRDSGESLETGWSLRE